MRRRWCLPAAIALLACGVAPCHGQSADPLPRVSADVYGAWVGLPTEAGWVPAVSSATPIPGRGWGANIGADAHFFRLGFATFGAGASIAGARATGKSLEATTTTNGVTTTTKVPTALVTTRVTNLSPHLSINFGHRLGWSYISAGYGVTKINSSALAVASSPALAAPNGWNPAINFGGGARWFMKQHVGAGFDVRWNKLSSRATTGTTAGAKRTQLFTIAVGVTLQ